MSPVLDHLFQSTAVLAAIALLTLFFRNNGADVRHGLWFAASLKFLVPFALLNALGLDLARLAGLDLPSFAPIETLYAAGRPFSGGAVGIVPAPDSWLLAAMLVWAAGILLVAAVWLSRWLTLQAAVCAARDAGIAAPMPVKISPALLEPGLAGVVRPVLLLPEGIAERLTDLELSAVIAHEACHFRRRDNLKSALHMLVEAIFWFWPPVWWLGARLMAARERACDEAVLAAGHPPQTYAQGILKVCKFYVASPLACAAGVSGSDLRQRMEEIMSNTVIARLSLSKKSLLAASAAALVLTPVAAGLSWSPAHGAAACTPQPVMETHTLPPYPPKSRDAKETGKVLLRLTIARNGHVSSARVAQSSGHTRLDVAAVEYVQQKYRWRPLSCGSAQTDLKVVFALANLQNTTFNQEVWIRHLQNDGAKVERLGGNQYKVTLPPPPK